MKRMTITTLAGAVGIGSAIALTAAINTPAPVSSPPPVVSIEVEEYEPRWTLPTGNLAEQYVLEQLQEHTNITDPNALAAILGNIKQESNFVPNICEGACGFRGRSWWR